MDREVFHPKWLQQWGPCWVKARNQGLGASCGSLKQVPGPLCFPRRIIRDWDPKWSSQDLNQHPDGMWIDNFFNFEIKNNNNILPMGTFINTNNKWLICDVLSQVLSQPIGTWWRLYIVLVISYKYIFSFSPIPLNSIHNFKQESNTVCYKLQQQI